VHRPADDPKIRKLRHDARPQGLRPRVPGLWPRRTEGGGVIDMAVWAGLTDPESRRDGDVALAVDIAPQRDYAAIGLYGVRADGVGHVQLVDYRPGTAWVVPRLVRAGRCSTRSRSPPAAAPARAWRPS
jgi:hypothetical protein